MGSTGTTGTPDGLNCPACAGPYRGTRRRSRARARSHCPGPGQPPGVATKASGSDIGGFGAGAGGRLSARSTVDDEQGIVLLAVSFDLSGHLLIAEARPNAVAIFALASMASRGHQYWASGPVQVSP